MGYVSDDADEEDFDMDVDVFSPPQPTLPPAKTRTLQRQPPLPDYLPLEVMSEKEQPSDEDQQVAILGKSKAHTCSWEVTMVL